MKCKNAVIFFVLMISAAFIYSSDTISTKAPSTTLIYGNNSAVIAVKTENKNQKKVTRPNTTWSKIKDLFM